MAKQDFDVQGAIKAVEEANDGVKFHEKICTAIDKSSDIQAKIKHLIWGTVKEKFLFFLITLLLLLGSNFLIGLAQEWGRKVAVQNSQNNIVPPPDIRPATTSQKGL